MKKLYLNLKAKAATGFLSSVLKPDNFQGVLFYLLILFIPVQFGYHFWPEFSFVKGIRVDYLSPTLYVTDILILLLFVKFLIFNFKFELKLKILNFKLIFLIAFLLVGIMFSKSPIVGAFGLLKLLEFIFLGFYVAYNIKKLKLKNILLMFSIGIIFESGLAISQFLNKGSLQGIFYFFGERFFNSQTVGIANASLGGELVLRPYGTFSHPNVLAGYLVIAMTLLIFNLQFSIKSKFSIFNFKTFLFLTSLVLGTIALFLTLSRVAIVLWILILGLMFVKRFLKTKFKISIFKITFFIFALGAVVFLLINSPLRFRFVDLKLSDESFVQRQMLIESATNMIGDHPILGVGLNNFLVRLPSYEKSKGNFIFLQPVHNTFLLVASETGAIGLGFFIWFIFKTIRVMKKRGEFQISNFKFQILLAVLLLGMFDHYPLTLQQGQLLLSVVLGLCWAKSIK